MPNMPIDWTSVDWVNVGLLSAIAFIAALIGNILIFRHWFWAAIVAGVLFAAGYVQVSGSGVYPGLEVTDSQG